MKYTELLIAFIEVMGAFAVVIALFAFFGYAVKTIQRKSKEEFKYYKE